MAATAALAWAAVAGFSFQKDKKEPETQILPEPPELPFLVAGTTSRLAFHVTPLSSNGLLSQQTRDALKALNRAAAGGAVVHIRAFVAGTGDIRRVRDLVGETFGAKGQPLPALSLVRVGSLAMTGAQVQLEAVSEGKKDVNPNGLAFISAEAAAADDPLSPIEPLARQALASLRQTLAGIPAETADVLRVTCYFSSLEEGAALRGLVASEYPRAAVSFVQPERAPGRALAAFEAVARLRRPSGYGVRLIGEDDSRSGAATVALASAPSLIFTGSQEAFGYEQRDGELAVNRLRAALERAGATSGAVVFTRWYPLGTGIAAQIGALRKGWFGAAQPPAGTMLLFEGLPSMDAGLGVDAVAIKY